MAIYTVDPALNNAADIIDFSANSNNNSISLKFKEKITTQTGSNGTKGVKIMVPLKYLSNFWRTLEMPSINCEINLQLTWSKKCLLVAGTVADQRLTFTITDAKLYVPAITSLSQDNAKFFGQLIKGFKRTINKNIYQSKITKQVQNRYLNFSRSK